MALSSPKKECIRVSIVEDDHLVRNSLAVLIAGNPGFTCSSAHATAEDAIEKIPEAKTDVVLMDIHLPMMSGIDCVRRLKKVVPEISIVMLTMYDDDNLVFEAIQAGASGYILKRTPHAQILSAIREVCEGGSPMSMSIARKVVQFLQQVPAMPVASSAESDLSRLSPRETEILMRLANGYRYKEIATTLGIAVETVRTHLRRIYEKLHVSSRTEATVKYLTHDARPPDNTRNRLS